MQIVSPTSNKQQMVKSSKNLEKSSLILKISEALQLPCYSKRGKKGKYAMYMIIMNLSRFEHRWKHFA